MLGGVRAHGGRGTAPWVLRPLLDSPPPPPVELLEDTGGVFRRELPVPNPDGGLRFTAGVGSQWGRSWETWFRGKIVSDPRAVPSDL